MSRIGEKPISIPEGVTVTITDNLISVKGPKGELKRGVHPEIAAEIKTSDGESSSKEPGKPEVVVRPRAHSKKSSALWGLTRSLVANMIEGVSRGFEKKLEFEGIGYRALVEGDTLVMQVGFSHPVSFKAPPSIKFLVEKNVITVSGIDKELVGQVASRVRAKKPPEPYKGKGVRYQGETVRRKAGKKAVASAS